MAKTNTPNNDTVNTTAPNGFTFFEGLATESASSPRITVRKNGLLVLTKAAIDMLKDGATHVRLGFDQKTNAVGLKAAPAETKGSYRLRSQKHGASRIADGKRFFAHLGMHFEKAQSFDAEEFGGGVVGFKLPASR